MIPGLRTPAGTGSGSRLDPGDRLVLHIIVFLVGTWNIFLTNWAHLGRGWWFWIPVVAWLAVLMGHAAWFFARRGRR